MATTYIPVPNLIPWTTFCLVQGRHRTTCATSGCQRVCFWAGKTHTMHGPPEDPGIYQRALAELFAAIGCGAKEPDQASDADSAEAAGQLTDSGGGSIAVAMLEV